MSPLPLPDGGNPRRGLAADSVSSSLPLLWFYPFRCDHTGLAAGRVVGKGNSQLGCPASNKGTLILIPDLWLPAPCPSQLAHL